MADWQRHIRLQPAWDRAKNGEISTADLAGIIAKKLRAIPDFGADVACSFVGLDDERDELAEEFEVLSRDPSASVREFDAIMSRLYDWGDQSLDNKWNGKKVCWIDTISREARMKEGAA